MCGRSRRRACREGVMGKSQRLRVRDVRDVFRLIGECRELGGNADEWRLHMATELCRLVAAQVAMCGWLTVHSQAWVAGTTDPGHAVDIGWPGVTARRRWLDYKREQRQFHDP